MIKLFCDIIFALVALILTLPVMLLSCLVILLTDRQNPVFTQQRLGRNKTPFVILKLRTMKNLQVTGLGRILRKTGIDELPQLFNIVFLQMSFVGPRPLTQSDIDRLGWNDSYHETRWKNRPGITGLAQLSPICHRKMSWFLDQKYVDCQSFFLDLKILFSSVAVLFVGKKKAIQWIHSNRNHEGTR